MCYELKCHLFFLFYAVSEICHKINFKKLQGIIFINSQVLGIMLSEVDAPGDRYNGKWIEMTRAVKLCHNKSNGYTYATGFGMNLDGSGDEVKTKITMKDRHAYVFLVLYILFCRKNGREVLKIEDFMGKVDCVSMEYQDD